MPSKSQTQRKDEQYSLYQNNHSMKTSPRQSLREETSVNNER